MLLHNPPAQGVDNQSLACQRQVLQYFLADRFVGCVWGTLKGMAPQAGIWPHRLPNGSLLTSMRNEAVSSALSGRLL
jgi:hypothetical protein